MSDASEEVIKAWLEKTIAKQPDLNEQLLAKACDISIALDQEHAEKNIQTGLEIADELMPLECDSTTLAAAILYPAFTQCNKTKELITTKLNRTVYKLLTGTKRLEAIDCLAPRTDQATPTGNPADNLRKMLLAIVDDIRVVLLKLAERLIILPRLRQEPEEKRQRVSQQIMTLYAPLANRLGIGQLKWQLEDLAFRLLEPEIYAQISKSLNMRRKDREDYIESVQHDLKELIAKNNIKNTTISGRAKHIYSIHRKIKRKKISFEDVYDTSAFRILVPTIEDCYSVLSLVHDKWEHIPQEFDDYIAKPKGNGYRSIHTAVVGPHNINVEIQIRTHNMHQEAELGVAAHWKYKENNQAQSNYEDKINLLREVMTWQKELSQDSDAQTNLYSKLFEDRVYVFTPNGDVLDMQTGSTPLDFAYHVHTEVGHRCRGAKINGKIVPLTQRLKTGDRVEILTSKTGQPSRDWLSLTAGYLNTSHARAKARHWFKQQNHQENVTKGQALWEKTYKREELPKNALNAVIERFNFKTLDDLLAAIGTGDIGMRTVLNRLKTPSETEVQEPIITETSAGKQKPAQVKVQGTQNVLTQLARCCQPIPGDPVVGYITKGRGISIHQQNCRNIAQSMKRRPERIIEVNWGKDSPEKYPVDLYLEASERSGIIRDISTVIANESISLLGINSRVNTVEHRTYINLTIEINSLESLQKTMQTLQQIPDIIKVTRRE